MKLNVLDEKGEKVKELEFRVPDKEDVSENTVLQAFRVLTANQRKHPAVTKTRGEVSGGGKKPWRQKGTGRARQGSIRSPIWRGGGVAHGPTGVHKTLKLNKKAFGRVMESLWSQRVVSGDVLLFNEKTFSSAKKTKDVIGLLDRLGVKSPSKNLILTRDKNFIRATRNLKGFTIGSPLSFNLIDLIKSEKVILSESDFDKVVERLNL